MSRTRVIELYENLGTMIVDDAKLKEWVARELFHLRKTWMDANGYTSQEKFADLVGLPWKTIDNIENQRHTPGVDTLNHIVVACDSNLAEFFQRVVTRMELASIQRESREETALIEVLVKGLANPKTKKVVALTAEAVGEILSALESQ